MAQEHWNRDWDALWPQFVFGQTGANDPSSRDPHGSHSIFVLASDLERLTKGRRHAAPTDVKSMLTRRTNDLAAMMGQSKRNTKDAYYDAALKKYPNLGLRRFGRCCWRNALKAKPKGVRDPSWDKSGVRNSGSTMPIEFPD